MRNRRRYSLLGIWLHHQQRRWLILLLGLLACWLTIMPLPSWAQAFANQGVEEAPVVLDGRILFQVRQLDQFTAQERAKWINQSLEQEVNSGTAIELEVVEQERGRLAIIRSLTNNRNLVTVTEADLRFGNDPVAQAQDWLVIIEHALKRSKTERNPVYQRQALMWGVAILLGAIVFSATVWFLQRLLLVSLNRWLNNPASQLYHWQQPTKLIFQLAFIGLQVGLWFSVIYSLLDLFPQARLLSSQFFNFINHPFISIGDKNTYSVLQVLILIAVSVALWFAVNALTNLFKSYVLVRSGAQQGTQDVLTRIIKYFLIFLGLIILFNLWGFDVTSLSLFGGVLGVGIGFGVQNIANNFISGIIIVIERPIQVGDFIKTGDLVGTVMRIGARSTEISTLDKVSIIIPNSRFLEEEVINWSHGDTVTRLIIPVGVAYGSDIRLVKRALLEAAKSHQDVLLRPRPEVRFQEFGDSSLNFDLLVWTGEPKKQPRIKSDLNYRIEASLHRYKIEVPFPQCDFHLRSPHIEQFIESWVHQYAPSPPTDVPQSKSVGILKESHTVSRVSDVDLFPEADSAPITELLDDDEPNFDLEEVVTRMRTQGGLEIKKRRFRLQSYTMCFVGSEAVDWMIKEYNLSRVEAVALGNQLKSRGIIHHVTDHHAFKDEYLFYRFYADE